MASRGNILLVANWDSDVGYAWWLMENFWITISSHFAKYSIKSHLIYPKIKEVPFSISNSNIEVHECNYRDHSLSGLKQLHRIIKTHNIRYVYLSDSPTYSVFYIILRLWGIKIIAVHDHTPGERTPASSWRKFLKSTIQKTPYYTADHFIAVTDFVYQRFINVACIPAKKCSVAPNGIIPIDLSKADYHYAQNEFNIPNNRKIIITTGRASIYKGIDFFIECANELINYQNHYNLHFLYCGDGPDINTFKSLVYQFNLEDRFTFTGKRSDIRRILPSCDIGFHAAIGEVGYSLSILEYMSAGLITIVPDRPSTALAVTNGKNGILYKPMDIHDAVKAIKFGLKEQSKSYIQNNAIKFIQEELNLSKTNESLIAALDPLIMM